MLTPNLSIAVQSRSARGRPSRTILVWLRLQLGLARNERITARVKLGSGAIRRVPMRVTAFEKPSRMEWTGGLLLGLFVGVRTFTLVPRDRVVEFRMHLRMSGPLTPLMLKSVGDRQPEVDRFSFALRTHVEHKASQAT